MKNEKLGTPNLKSVVARFGFIAEEMETEMETAEEKDLKLQFAAEARAALNGILKAGSLENSNKRTDMMLDEHNRKYGTMFKRRNLDLKEFDELPE